MISNLTRFVLIVWIFVVLVLSNSYTASLTSLLTVQQLQPTATAISDLINRGSFIGYQEGSFTYERLKEYVNESKLRVLRTSEDYIEALSNGSVSAVVDELPYLRLVRSTNCSSSKFRMVGLTNRTAGFGFVSTKSSFFLQSNIILSRYARLIKFIPCMLISLFRSGISQGLSAGS